MVVGFIKVITLNDVDGEAAIKPAGRPGAGGVP